jgi:hypothetical protein
LHKSLTLEGEEAKSTCEDECMKVWHRSLSVAIVGFCVLAGSLFPTPAHCEEAGRKMLHLFSLDFPSDLIVHYPSPAIQETRFWQLMDREMQATDDLTLTENVEKADYRVELRCAGVFSCSALAVDIKDPNRNVLSSFTLKHIAPYWGLGKADLDKVSRQLTIRLDEQIRLLDQGGYGYSE